MGRTHEWIFPLPRTHTGILLGNGVMGVMAWGEGNVLRLTVGRADFWDHRGGMPWTPQQSYANIRSCLENGDEPRLRELFESTVPGDGLPECPSVLPVGRVDLVFGPRDRLLRGILDMDRGEIVIVIRSRGRERRLRLTLDMTRPLCAVALPPGLAAPRVEPVTAWDYVGEYLASISFDPPEPFADQETCGWTQTRPADPALALACRRSHRRLFVATALGHTSTAARAAVRRALARATKAGIDARNRRWWSDYWDDVPSIVLPNSRLQFLYDYGMYKFAGLTHPDGIAATLQGPWIEEYQMPPWSSDYHFNINVQMCYWPAYHGNRLEHLRPLFDLVESWLPTLRHNARMFVGIRDGVMLPHAVDDRCTCMGGFWTGSVDHGCTAWVAQMMFRYYEYTQDRDFLERTAYPFMCGAMRVYEAMLEWDGDVPSLPVSVSPEYGGCDMDAWGRDASFQLACIHRLCEDLAAATKVLGKRPRPVWKRISENLPRACFDGRKGREEIALWKGKPFAESHRHHSHLAGLTPFDIFDWRDDPPMFERLKQSLQRWILNGPGLWSGWCMPWASMIHTRVGNSEAAELYLEIWQRVFTNEGDGTLHDADVSGFSLIGRGPMGEAHRPAEIMQIEAGMSCVAAIQEMLLHVHRGVTYLFAGAPARWPTVSFRNMRTVGAFLVDAERRDGQVRSVTVRSLAGGDLRLANPWPETAARCVIGRRETSLSGDVLSVTIAKGRSATLTPSA